MNERLWDSRASAAGRDDAAAALEARFARRVVARLAEQADALPHDVAERLRFARCLAMERARLAVLPAAVPSTALTAAAVSRGAVLAGGARPHAPREPSVWWMRLVAALPLAALLGGLVLIQQQHVGQQIAAAAEIDADLLSDALPPSAYGDAGFLEFLKAPQN